MNQRGFANERETIRDYCLTKWCHPFITPQCFLIFKIFSIWGCWLFRRSRNTLAEVLEMLLMIISCQEYASPHRNAKSIPMGPLPLVTRINIPILQLEKRKPRDTKQFAQTKQWLWQRQSGELRQLSGQVKPIKTSDWELSASIRPHPYPRIGQITLCID